jgi:hypothetical protein
MHGSILPLPNTPSCGGAQLKKKRSDNFTFVYGVVTKIRHSKWILFQSWQCESYIYISLSLSLSLPLAPQTSLGLGLLRNLFSIKNGWISWRLLNNFLFYRVGLLATCPIPTLEDLYLYPPEAGWLPILVASYDTHGLRWDYSYSPVTTYTHTYISVNDG